MINIGLVVEGKDDVPIVSACLEAELRTLGVQDLQFTNLQPALDATGKVERGGWTKVAGWLANYSGGSISTFLTPLFRTATACDIIVIHMDSDVQVPLYKSIGSSTPISGDPKNTASEIENELRRLLNAGNLDQKVCFAIPVHKSENWLMAGSALCSDHRWQLPDGKAVIRTLFDPAQYGSIALMIAAMIQEIEQSTDLLHSRAHSYRPFRTSVGLAIA